MTMIKQKFSSNRLPAHYSSQDKDPILLNNTHTCTSFPRNFCMDFQEHFFPFPLQPSACTRLFYKGIREDTCEGVLLHMLCFSWRCHWSSPWVKLMIVQSDQLWPQTSIPPCSHSALRCSKSFQALHHKDLQVFEYPCGFCQCELSNRASIWRRRYIGH